MGIDLDNDRDLKKEKKLPEAIGKMFGFNKNTSIPKSDIINSFITTSGLDSFSVLTNYNNKKNIN